MTMDLCPYCRQRTAVKILQKNDSELSKVQCLRCSRSYQVELALRMGETQQGEVEGDEMTMHKAAVSLEPDSAGKITSALTPAELDTLWETRLANAQKGISDPYARKNAYDEELRRLVTELHQVQRTAAGVSPIISDVRAEMEALGKDDALKTPLDLIKEARRHSRLTDREFGGYRN